MRLGLHYSHQWLFVPDTTDAVYPPDDWTSEALLDRVATAMQEKRINTNSIGAVTLGQDGGGGRRTRNASEENIDQQDHQRDKAGKMKGKMSLRRPILAPRRVERIEELAEFFRNVSISSYEAVYNSSTGVVGAESGGNGGVDEAYSEGCLLKEMFDQRDE